MTGPRILFVVDAGPSVGGGHVMRSLTLARALEAQGASFTFVGPPAVSELLDAFAPDAARIAAEDLAAAAVRESFDAIVFDHYGLSEPDHRAMAQGRPVLVIDDLANRPLGADIVLDAGPGRRAEDYNGLIRAHARLLLGPTFAPVRPEFAALREPALAWRGEPVQRILIAMGLTDVGGITARIVERVRPRVTDVGLDIVLGGAAPSMAGLAKVARRDQRLLLHVDTPHMARLTAEADIGIGAPGSSTWERCTLGLPSLLIVLADNQRAAAQAVAERGAALVLDVADPDFEAAFDRAFMRLLRDPALRRNLATSSAALCDGLGAGRTGEAFLNLIGTRKTK
ncbi:UDP-2,4-diacetamido-2,4,6-trideoxy-beta-L-altropyranose hydrolase [Phenylobacterium kunshanense]|uniref:UDP-2,4-diacetamido-2,4, 6-trideoxy-beta-L-altropyranose hydrolase n=1 Tax=Phenylobacterium kunshanense TaxID=1445034 RepID=A0A328BE34_9CAUL|nr:UDP-2,4-diacetamido-2,4,6-trideoxy-beta-L-altropyranose hydrolase [Phenylobacterium kunshanense]RAK65602.1 UDP-2,4-diacetamido-2,4,6-trideoxy-beta-L-altropyranose hydrolase [Phenylobacterium kunshanense]